MFVERVYVPKTAIRRSVANIFNLGHSFCWICTRLNGTNSVEKDKKM